MIWYQPTVYMLLGCRLATGHKEYATAPSESTIVWKHETILMVRTFPYCLSRIHHHSEDIIWSMAIRCCIIIEVVLLVHWQHKLYCKPNNLPIIYIYIYIYTYIVIHRQTVSFNQNSSVWLDTQDARSRDRNPSNFTLVCVSDHSATNRTTLAKGILRYFYF